MPGLLLRKRCFKDHKRRSFPKSFGTTTNLVDCEYDLNLTNLNQNIPNAIGDPALPEACTAFLRADMATNEDRIIYDPQFTYDKACFEQNVPVGSPLPLQAAFDSARVDGLKAVGEPEGMELNHRRGPYAEVHPMGGQDWFDAIWSALNIGKRPIGNGTLWYNQLTQNTTVDSLTIIPSSDGHAWEITGVTTTDQPRMHIKWWGGEPKWFSRATINALLGATGSDCLMDVDGKATLDDLKSVGFIYTLRVMLLSLLKRLLTYS